MGYNQHCFKVKGLLIGCHQEFKWYIVMGTTGLQLINQVMMIQSMFMTQFIVRLIMPQGRFFKIYIIVRLQNTGIYGIYNPKALAVAPNEARALLRA